MKPIYEPKGKAKEYGEWAINIYTGCPHRCFYCFAPAVLRKDKETFHSLVEPRKNIVEEVRKQLEKEQITGKLIHLCFTCDPYPTGYDSTPTREIIKLLKEYGNHVQILTKGNGTMDFDLLDDNDWYGVTIDGTNNGYTNEKNLWGVPYGIVNLRKARENYHINTWISFEPVVDAKEVFHIINEYGEVAHKIKIGKLNYLQTDIDWAEFGETIESLCIEKGLNYYIKDSLRECMK